MRRLQLGLAATALLCVIPGCATTPTIDADRLPVSPPPSVLKAYQTHQPIVLDGVLDEPAWASGTGIALSASRSDDTVTEGGAVHLVWDNLNLYVGVRLTDSDVVQEDDRDQQLHFQMGDVIEVFLKPDDQTWYWEFYATPQGRKSALFLPGRGRFKLPGNLLREPTGLSVGARIDGTLNQWRDRDRGWTAEITIARSELAQMGSPLDPGTEWSILVARYNYGRWLNEVELSSAPTLDQPAFHTFEGWGKLDLVSTQDNQAVR